ncbi:hypothetical protein K7432_002654 [Basidiobolus ranarum]|uniref:non-specific serine/threonine protein kinase n=1 Tax=Basidiobolus ranarum TaxID=34480 RepID=A0ABR2X186_9FUNG
MLLNPHSLFMKARSLYQGDSRIRNGALDALRLIIQSVGSGDHDNIELGLTSPIRYLLTEGAAIFQSHIAEPQLQLEYESLKEKLYETEGSKISDMRDLIELPYESKPDFDSKVAHTIFMMDGLILTEIVLKFPSYFDSVFQYVSILFLKTPSNGNTSINELRNGMLLMMERLCQSQKNFMSSTIHNSPAGTNVSENRQMDLGRLEFVTNLLGVILRARVTHSDTKNIAIFWIGKIIDSFQNQFGNNPAPSLAYKLLASLISDILNQYDHDLIFRKSHLSIVKKFVTYCGNREESQPIFNKLLECLYVSDLSVHGELVEILTYFDPLLTMTYKGSSGSVMFETFKTCVRCIPHLGTFRPQHFQIAMDYLGIRGPSDQGRKHDTPNGFAPDWRERLFHSCQAVDGLHHTNFFKDLEKDMTEGEAIRIIENSEEMLTYWVLWEAARYCVLARSRTPFGGAQQTFEAFEKALVSAISSGLAAKSASTDDDNYSVMDLQRIRDLVVFIDLFEFQIYNAAVGTAVSSIPLAPRASIIFFRTNLKVCEDWFIRNRKNIIHASKRSGSTCSLIRHSLKFVREQTTFILPDILKNSQRINDIIEVLTIVIPLLVDNGDEDGVNGLLNYCRDIFKQFRNLLGEIVNSVKENVNEISIMPRGIEEKLEEQAQAKAILFSLEKYADFTWLFPSIQLARGNIEYAANESARLYSSTDNTVIKAFMAKQVYECYSHISDWKSMAEWAPIVDQVLDNQPHEELYTKALCHFDTKKYTEVEMELHELLPIQNTTILAMPQDVTRKLQPKLLHTILNKVNGDTNPEFEGSKLNGILDDCLSVLSRETYQDFFSPLITLQYLNLFRTNPDRILFNLSNVIPEVDYTQQNLLLMLAYHQLPELFLKASSSNLPVIKSAVDQVTLTTAKLARENRCFETAETVLKKLRSTKCFDVLFEDALLMYQKGQADDAVRKIVETIQNMEIDGLDKSRVALKIAEWIDISPIPSQESQEILSLFIDTSLEDSRAESYTSPSELESLKSTCYNFAINNNSDDPQAWLKYAQHLDNSIVDTLSQRESYNSPVLDSYLRDQLEASVYSSLFPASDNDSFKQQFFRDALQKTQSDDLSWVDGLIHDNSSISSTDVVEIKSAVERWYSCVRKDFATIVQAYFRFLSSCASKEAQKRSQTKDGLTCALRILKILFKYGSHLKDVFEEQNLVNAWPWDQIVPQLFAGLQHSDQYVQDFTTKMLCILAAASPQAVAYHAIVESLSPSDEKRKYRAQMIVEALHRNNDQVVNEITKMISEFRRIAVLWEDLWTDKIAHLQPELAKRAQQLKLEFDKIEQNKLYSPSEKEKAKSDSYSAIFQSIIITLEKLCDMTINRTPCTPREEWFVETFRPLIETAITNLKTPKSLKKIKESWETFKEIETKLSKEFTRGKTLRLADVSPYLAAMKDSIIHIPGLSASEEEITIHSIKEEILVIPTKTKPKKLVFVGSDGKNYGYLFKGLEDLHLDERMMQILRITNRLLKRDPEANRRALRARNYGVIPLGNHSGMIQWVDNTSTLFTLYRKWQYRETTSNMMMQPQEQMDTKAPPAHPSKPNEVFYEKIAAALKDAGVSPSTPRKNWPVDILRKVYLDLVSETPSTLLEKELWASCSTSTIWYKKSKSFVRSLAVMSVIGYIIGLGDRHLDNILIDFVQGEIIHIDYNVCFEKGKRLRIPETVPFRLTQNFQAALDVFGGEEYFKQAGAHSLRVLRENKKSLLTLLDAFVYDPLLDWSQDSKNDKDERPLEVSVNLGLLASRMAKSKEELETHRQKLVQSLLSIETTTDNITSAIGSLHIPGPLKSDSPSNESTANVNEDPEKYIAPLRDYLNQCKVNHENVVVAFEELQHDKHFSPENPGSLVFSEFTSKLDPSSALVQKLAILDNHVQEWDKEQISLKSKCLDHLEHYKAYTAGSSSHILAQDFHYRWEKVIDPLLLSNLEYDDFSEALARYENLKPSTSSKLSSWQNLLSRTSSDTTKLQQVYGQLIGYLQGQINKDQPMFVGKDPHGQLSQIQLGATWTALVELYQLFDTNSNDTDIDILAVIQQKFGIRTKFLPDTELVKDVDIVDVLTYILKQLVEILRDHLGADNAFERLNEKVGKLTKLPQAVFSFETNLYETIIPQIFSLFHHSPKIFTNLESSLNEVLHDTAPEDLKLHHEMNIKYLAVLEQVKDVEVADGIHNFEKNFSEIIPWLEMEEQTVTLDYKERLFESKLQLLSQIFNSVRLFTQNNDDLNFTTIPPICSSEVFKNEHTKDDIAKTIAHIRRNILLDAHNKTMAQLCKHTIGAIMTVLEGSIGNIKDNDNANKNLIKHFVNTGVCALSDIHAERAMINQYVFETFKTHKLTVITHRKQLLDRTFSFQSFYFAKFQWLNKPYISEVTDIKVVEDLKQDNLDLQHLNITAEELFNTLEEIETNLTNATWSNLSLNISESLLHAVRSVQKFVKAELETIQIISQPVDTILQFENMRVDSTETRSSELNILEILKACQMKAKSNRDQISHTRSVDDVVIKMLDLKLDNVQESIQKLMSDIGWLYTSMEEILNEISGLVRVLYSQTKHKPEVRSIHQRFKAFMIVYSDFSYYFDTLFEALESLFGNEDNGDQMKLSELNDNIQGILERVRKKSSLSFVTQILKPS